MPYQVDFDIAQSIADACAQDRLPEYMRSMYCLFCKCFPHYTPDAAWWHMISVRMIKGAAIIKTQLEKKES
jgi:hypothetical protein